MPRPPTLLYVDPDPAARQRLGEAFQRGGLVLRAVAQAQHALQGARALKPDLVLVRSEVRGPILAGVLQALAEDAWAARLPLVLLAHDTSDGRFVQGLRTGVVGLLPEPFDPARHLAQLRALLGELGQRRGSVSRQGDSRELAQLVEHLRRTRRSGELTVNPRTPEQGRALFARGVLQEAEHLGAHGVEALVGMVASPRSKWTFVEVGAEPAEVVIDLERTTGEFPLAELKQAGPDEEVLEGGIPLELGDVRTGEVEIPVEPGPSPAAAPDRARVLLVDDDEALCRMFSLLFTRHGFEVAVAADGLAGYEAAAQGGCDLVVADLNMPRMDGWGMLRLLRDDFRTRELPVAFLSCHDDYRDALRALDAGAQAYFSKATRLDALVSQVRALLEPRAQARAALLRAEPVSLAISRVGPQWLVRELGRQGRSGVLEARDGWAHYRLTFRDGRPQSALARAGRHSAEGERAFNAFVASRGAEGSFGPGVERVSENLSSEAGALLDAAVAALNAREAKVREALLVHATRIDVNPDLYALYTQVGPAQWLESARLICEERLPPREVIARVEASPLEVEETVRDLIRRGVITLTA